MYANKSLKRYVEELAAKTPVPGGGSAAGLAGAAGTALLEMVCNFTLGNEKYKNHHEDTKKHITTLKKIRGGFLALVDDDAEVYTAIRNAFKAGNKKNIDKALKDGYCVSEKVCRLSKGAMEIAMDLAAMGNINLISDVGCGAELLKAAFASGVFNCRINLKGIGDNVFMEKETVNMDILKREIEMLHKKTLVTTEGRMG